MGNLLEKPPDEGTAPAPARVFAQLRYAACPLHAALLEVFKEKPNTVDYCLL
jgi:hypothetical protein